MKGDACRSLMEKRAAGKPGEDADPCALPRVRKVAADKRNSDM